MAVTTQPFYQRIKEDILSQIESGRLTPGDRLPTEFELMEQYQVSRITVSKALNDLKDKGIVVRYPNKGSFVAQPDNAGNSLVREMPTIDVPIPAPSGAMIEIGCIIPSISDNFSMSLVNGVLSAFPWDRYVLHFFQSINPTMENYLLQRCLDLNFAGIVLFPQDQPFFSKQLMMMLLQQYPLVLVDRYLPRLDTSYVISDSEEAGRLCISHLTGLGHRRIGMILSNDKSFTPLKKRISGIRNAMEEHGLSKNDLIICDHFNIELSHEENTERIRDMITKEHVTAIITAQSSTAPYLYDLLAKIGFRVPEDISILSFDRPMTNTTAPNFFTHIDQSERMIGQQAGLLLKNHIEQQDKGIYHKVIQPSLEVSQSTGPANH